MDYKQKYLKYKQKYKKLKGGWRETPVNDRREQINHIPTIEELTEHACPICINHSILNVKFILCGHCICYECYQRMTTEHIFICPICRAHIDNIFILNIDNNMWEKQVRNDELVGNERHEENLIDIFPNIFPNHEENIINIFPNIFPNHEENIINIIPNVRR